MVSRYPAYRRGVADDDTIAPEIVDRILIGTCGAIWLVLLGVSVAAAVALADLGRGFHKAATSPHTTWVLYAVIIISALIIAGAIPMLLRARRMAQTEPAARGMTAPDRPPVRLMSQAPRTAAERARQPKVQAPAAAAPDADWSGEAVDRVWLRGTILLVGAIGAALVAVAAATYLMAVGRDGPSWVAYGLAGAITAGMPVIEWQHVRQLRRIVVEQ